jgi:methionyl-tRNA formyltransferase
LFAAADNVRPRRLPRARTPAQQENCMAKKVKKSKKRVAWSRAHHAELRKHSKAKTPVARISKLMKRTAGALRQQALKLGIPLGHRR